MRAANAIPLADRLAARSRVLPSGCVEWIGHRNSQGYGWVYIGGIRLRAHRAAYEVAKGPIPDGLHIDHLCRNPSCINPDHLEAVTLVENVLRGDGFAARNARKTHCPEGHPLSDNNLSRRPNGWRCCRTCKSIKNRKYYLELIRPRRLAEQGVGGK